MRDQLTQERFEEDIAEHKMEILREEDVYRHIRFSKPGSSDMYFDLITWPGYLCYTGDMGTYVFQRTSDMFEFFRRPEHCRYSIDMRYWAEKVEAGDKCSMGDGITEFSKEKFDEAVWEAVNQFIDQCKPDPTEDPEVLAAYTQAMADLKLGVQREVIEVDDNDVRCYDAANDFTFGNEDSSAWHEYFGGGEVFCFTDWFEVDTQDYTLRFKWCCLALSWAMQTYDKHKEKPA